MKKKDIKTYYYDDPLSDDFAGTNLKKKPLPKNFKYVHKNIFYRFFATILYRLIALPVLFLVGKIGYGVKVKGKKNLKALRKTGYFLYGNHTQIADAWLGQCFMTGGKRTYVLADQDATSIRGVRTLVMMLGCIPIPLNAEEKEKFNDCVKYRIEQKAAIVVYPEAHIWKYSTHIRPFRDDSFVYPAYLGVPMVAFCVTYRKRKVFKNASPRMTVHISTPFYPDMTLSLAERRAALREQAYEFMIKHSAEDENVEWIRYLPRPKEGQE